MEWKSISAAQRTLNECWSVPDQPAAGNLSESAAFRLGQKVKILRTCLHGMNEKLVALSNRRRTKFDEANVGVEAEPELPCCIVIVNICHKDAVFGSISSVFCADDVLQCGRIRLHYGASSQARTAARIASERLRCSRSARVANAFNRVASM